MTAPKSLVIRTYHVGFGDCFLLSFRYSESSEKHVLIDFGSTGLPKNTPHTRMDDVAADIKRRTNGKLHAVVATHRHKDHISGFATKKNGKGSGDVIRALKPNLVVQPWTEDPKLAKNAAGPADQRTPAGKQIAALTGMHGVAAGTYAESKRARFFDKDLKGELSFIGEDNLANLSVVKNLMDMAPNDYVFAGKATRLAKTLPGVSIDVLGPPTVKQTNTIKKQRSRDPDEFWQLQANAMAAPANRESNVEGALFPKKYVRSRGGNFPVSARWFVHHSRAARGNQLLQIVRMLDKAMNNTSVILLFRVGKTSLLFPGDAQIENWKFALGQPKIRAKLAKVNLYKVGHHGSRNATPLTLWKLFDNRTKKASAKNRMAALMSTMPGKHGHPRDHTEVPRQTLVQALKTDTNLFSTESLAGSGHYLHDTMVTF